MALPIDSRQLRAFVTLARNGSFTRTARELHLSQPAVSHSIKALETEMRCRLFDRMGKSVSLTQAGEQFLAHAQKILLEMDAARERLSELGKWGAGTCQVDATRQRQVRVPVSNLLLIGARPGEIFHCQSRSDVRCESILAMVSFMPVWALPLDPAHADKESARILLFHPSEPLTDIQMPVGNRTAIRKLRVWISAIREAGCKGLALAPADEQTKALWRRYRVTAKKLRRRML